MGLIDLDLLQRRAIQKTLEKAVKRILKPIFFRGLKNHEMQVDVDFEEVHSCTGNDLRFQIIFPLRPLP